jgi:multiple sugar transport system permease protein
MIPQFVVIRNLGLVDNLMALILIGAFSPFGVFLFRQFFLTIPEELSEAARIDGCSEFGIYFRIMLPLAKPAIASLIIFTFVNSWNEFQQALIYLSSDEVKTLQLGMRNFQTMYSQNFALLMAAAVCAMVPTIAVYLLAQDYFIEGIATTGLKG